MRIMIIAILCFVFAGGNLTVSWGGPLSELTEPGEVNITGINAIKKAIELQLPRKRLYNAVSARPPRRLEQATPEDRPTKVQVLSDSFVMRKAAQMERSFEIDLVPPKQGQYFSAEFFPTSPGTTWTYLSDDSKIAKVKVLPELAIIRGVETNIAANIDTGVSVCYTNNSDGILIHRELIPNINIQKIGTVDLLVSFIPPIRLIDSIITVGQASYSIGTAHYTILPQRRSFNLDYTASYTVRAHKTITVPAGTLEVLQLDGTFVVSGDFESETFSLAKNMGLAKHEVESGDEKQTRELSFIDIVP